MNIGKWKNVRSGTAGMSLVAWESIDSIQEAA
jgi:hypothetical protein